MPAQNRKKEGIYYHIYNIGIEKRDIFKDEDDYKVFLGYLEGYLSPVKDQESTKKTFEIHGRTYRGTPHQPKNYYNKIDPIAYSLMPQHFHLVLSQITERSVENFIRSLCTRYSMYFNKKYHRSGSLFEGPCKSVEVEMGIPLTHLTRYLHFSCKYSSYPEYLGQRVTSWIKSEPVLSSFENGAYKDFVEKYEHESKSLGYQITIDNEKKHHAGYLETRDLSSNSEIAVNQDLKTNTRLPHFLAISLACFLVLTAFGVKNIYLSTSKVSQLSKNQSQKLSGPIKLTPSPQVLSETDEAIASKEPEEKSKEIVIVKLDSPKASVNIREQPSTDSAKLEKAHDGDTLELISESDEWYEIKLEDGQIGFISARYVLKEEKMVNDE